MDERTEERREGRPVLAEPGMPGSASTLASRVDTLGHRRHWGSEWTCRRLRPGEAERGEGRSDLGGRPSKPRSRRELYPDRPQFAGLRPRGGARG